jgi:hypothetical protein
MKTDFLLYLDILGFEALCLGGDPKVEQIYECLLQAKSAHYRSYKIVIFSDTVLIQNIGIENPMYSLMFLCEFFIDLQYWLSKINVFIRGVIKNGPFTLERRQDVEIFYGPAIIAAYRAEKTIKAVGLFMCNGCAEFNHIHTLTHFDSKHSFVQTLLGVVKHFQLTCGGVEVDRFILEETDELCHLKDDIQLLQLFSQHRRTDIDPCVKAKHEATWQLIRSCNEQLLDALEEESFDLDVVNDEFDWSRMGMYES